MQLVVNTCRLMQCLMHRGAPVIAHLMHTLLRRLSCPTRRRLGALASGHQRTFGIHGPHPRICAMEAPDTLEAIGSWWTRIR